MVYGIYNLSFPDASNASVHGGRMSLPVDPASLIYSHFEHVSGTPAPNGTTGVSIDRLHLMNVLIGLLNKAGISPPVKSEVNDEASSDEIEAKIQAYRNMLQETKAAGESMPYVRTPNLEPGSLFSLLG